MTLSEAKRKYLFTTKIELEDGDYIVLREPTIEEMQLFKSKSENDEAENFKTLEQLLPVCLVDHTFTNETGGKVSNKEIFDFLKSSASLFTEIVDTWFKSLPFQQRLANKKK